MKNLFDAAVAEQIKRRLSQLGPQSKGLWGKMTAPQMLAHCSLGMQWAVGDTVPEKAPLAMRLLGRLVKPMVLRNEVPMRRDAPTAKSLLVWDSPNLDRERERLCELIDKFRTGGATRCTRHPHSFFGKLTPEEWAVLTYKHLDHHLRQFGV